MSGLGANMRKLLERLAVEDGELPDPTLLLPQHGRTLVALTSDRWNGSLPDVAESRTVIHDGKPALRITPWNDRSTDAILYVHGGGWSFCSPLTHESVARRLAISCACPVLVPGYRLAPEHPWPAGLQDVLSAWSARPANRRWSMGGDSAGANLALATMLRLAGEKSALPASGLLFYGVYGASFDTESYLAYADGPWLSRAKMMRFWDWYAPAGLRANPEVAPLAASDDALAALPPLYLNSAALDPLLSDTERLVARLRAIGRDDIHDRFNGVVHGFMQMGNSLSEARTAFGKSGAAFRRLTANQGT